MRFLYDRFAPCGSAGSTRHGPSLSASPTQRSWLYLMVMAIDLWRA